MHNVRVPEMGEGITEATLACWHVKSGDQCQVDDEVVELVTDKASFSVNAGCKGVVKDVLAGQGDNVKIGEVIALIEEEYGSSQ